MFMTVWTVRREKIIMKIIYQLTSVWPHNAQCSSHSGECWRRNAITSLQNARPASPCTLVAAVYLALLLSRIMADREGLANFRWSRSWVVCCQCCILRLHNYRATLLVRSSFACCWSPSTRLAHLTHLTRRLCGDAVRALEEWILIISVTKLLEIAVWIIENEKDNSVWAQNHRWIIRILRNERKPADLRVLYSCTISSVCWCAAFGNKWGCFITVSTSAPSS